MSVSYTYSADFGGRITVGLPRHVDRRVGLDICDAVESVVKELLEGLSAVDNRPSVHVPIPASDKETETAEKEDADSSLAEWPSVGMVTVSDIVKFWNIGRSSFRNRVREGIFSKAVDCPDRAFNAPKVWDAAVVGAELAKAGYVRRGF